MKTKEQITGLNVCGNVVKVNDTERFDNGSMYEGIIVAILSNSKVKVEGTFSRKVEISNYHAYEEKKDLSLTSLVPRERIHRICK